MSRRVVAGVVIIGLVHISVGLSATVTTILQGDAWQSPVDGPTADISEDGRFVVFSSYTPLVAADGDTHRDVYVFDRAGGRVTLESVAPPGRRSSVDSAHPGISGDGRYVVFEMEGEIAFRDRQGATTTVLGAGHDPVISADGRFVAFASFATDIAPGGDANGGRSDVYLIDVITGIARRVSVDRHGVQHSIGSSITPSVSADGRYVAFASTAPLHGAPRSATGDRPLISGIYVHDVRLGATRLIGVSRADRLENADSWRPVISSDGRYVAFVSASAGLAAGDLNRSADVFVADVHIGSTELVSRTASGNAGNGASRAPALSADGRVIAFQSLASNLLCSPCSELMEDINLLSDVFLLDTRTRAMVRVSRDVAGGWMEPSTGPALDASGSLVTYSSRHPINATDKGNDFDLFVVNVTR
jgi:Tol biopolymer transport system component